MDELKSQLADYQQAPDVQQTRAIQYNQLRHCSVRKSTTICLTLTPDSADEWLDTFRVKEQEATEKLLSRTENERRADRAQPV